MTQESENLCTEMYFPRDFIKLKIAVASSDSGFSFIYYGYSGIH